MVIFMMDNLNLTYRQYHENFMQNHSGASVEETILIQSPIVLVIFMSMCVVNWVDRDKTFFQSFNLYIVKFVIEFSVIVVTQILVFTMPEYTVYFYIFLYSVGLYLIVMIIIRFRNKSVLQERSFRSLQKMFLTGKRAYITYFRASVNLTTSICILAVDFTSFPRALAKTETYGFSVMDAGVGYFVVCSGLVGSHEYRNCNEDKKERPIILHLKRNAPLLFIGLMRIFLTKNVDYQSHVTEYGVHWNFFLTLAFVRFLSALLLKSFCVKYVKYLAAVIIIVHQFILSSGIQDWVLSDAPRDSLISGNREGIVSVIGYVGLYLVSVELKNQLIKKETTLKKEAILLIKLILSATFLYGFVLLLDYYLPCSRRLVNVTYIAWVIMLSLYLLSFALFVELILMLNSSNIMCSSSLIAPTLLESINYNALSYFLLANALTGVVNLSIETLNVSKGCSILILIFYMFTSCSVINYLYYKNYKII